MTGALLVLLVVLGGCVPAAGCPWDVGDALLQNVWQTRQACRR